MLEFCYAGEKNAVMLYASLTNYNKLYTVANVMSLAKSSVVVSITCLSSVILMG